ncbi:YlbG family protein [Vagococcus entomophilus]|uniref:UPF0298 protein CBF30_11385 n=1 Tax=Vagococcus entomophilus TaxID=1160095 RepID=A0A430AEM7_9ENTE|nr:YlbG family protein [Vagococcus entomophilus]RSU05909.1 hypothetical protein CBF30_11385 [Vagococcus entomophilus]
MLDKEIKFEVTRRRSLVIWVYSLRQVKNLRRFGTIQYVSRKMKYVILYMPDEEIEATEFKLNKLHFVRQVERSYRPDVEMNFADKIGKKELFELEEDELFDSEHAKKEIVLAEQ